MMVAWFLSGVLLVVVILLCIKIWYLKKSMNEICSELKEHLSHESNVLISISSRDTHVRRVAAELNTQLRILRKLRLQYLDKDKELKESITNIAHDLRTPLTAICGYVDLLEDMEKSEEVARYLNAIKERSEIMRQLSDELFHYSLVRSKKEKKVTTTIINRVLEDSIAGFYALLQQKNITPTIHITENKIIRNLDASDLFRVFSNLIMNAIKYSDGDLNITLKDDGEMIFVNTASRLNEIQVGKLFDRFYTVDSPRQSHGLGLAITRSLLAQMDGSISAKYVNNQLHIHILL